MRGRTLTSVAHVSAWVTASVEALVHIDQVPIDQLAALLAQIGALYFTPDKHTVTTFELGAFAPSDRSLKLSVYSVTLRVRRQIYRDWLYLEVTPQILYQEANGFSATRSLMLQLEMLFGDRYLQR